jgi:hypothetical protein
VGTEPLEHRDVLREVALKGEHTDGGLIHAIRVTEKSSSP